MKLLQKKDFTIPPTGISEVATLAIGGIPQTILIQAVHPDKPVLLFLHGGPSMPIPGVNSRSRDYALATATKELVKHYVVVFWDQRGTGRSYRPDIPPGTMRISQFVSDAEELTDYLRERFRQDKIVIAAHSWGTVIGLTLAAKVPHKLHAYVGISQLINWPENDRLCRDWVMSEAQKRGDRKAVRALEKLGEPPYTESFEQWGQLRKRLMKYNSMIYKEPGLKAPSLSDAAMIMLRSPDYELKHIYYSLYKGFLFSYSQQMIEDFAKVDFMQQAPRLDVPAYFIHGRKDVHVHGSLVERYVDALETAGPKELYWIEKSAHMFRKEDAKEIERILIERVGASHTS
ncbi:alpha/beta fold hydrolase [Paenibacillus chartarius]|uniref:Alpha/beta fold hydrolase n=1 Tax=Paenibacillus chartarius TaxID=747481 RepID=A0ABV6DFN4_9BACL